MMRGSMRHQMGKPTKTTSYCGMRVTLLLISGRAALSCASRSERLSAPDNLRSSSVYSWTGTISNRSPCVASAISSANFFVDPLTEKYATSAFFMSGLLAV